jgi:hypothetical protein
MKLVVALVFMISPWSEAALWLLSRVGAMGRGESHTFSEIFREKQCGAPPRARCGGWLRIDAVV